MVLLQNLNFLDSVCSFIIIYNLVYDCPTPMEFAHYLVLSTHGNIPYKV